MGVLGAAFSPGGSRSSCKRRLRSCVGRVDFPGTVTPYHADMGLTGCLPREECHER
jgi:hypothetical protein